MVKIMNESTKTTIEDKLFEIQNLGTSYHKKGKAHYGSYLTLDDLWATLQPILKERKILVTHFAHEKEVKTVVQCMESNGAVSSAMPLPDNLEPQKLGSAVTYFKRYNLAMIFNILADLDDDGVATVPKKKELSEEELAF